MDRVPAKGYVPRPDELRFDMFEAEYTHAGDRCTFEVLAQDLVVRAFFASGVTAELVHLFCSWLAAGSPMRTPM